MATQTIAGIICASAIAAPVYKIICLNKKVKKNWNSIKCTPLGMLLYPIYGPSSISAASNVETCLQGTFTSMFDSSISSTNNNVSLLTEITSSISNDVNSIRTKIQDMEQSAYDDLNSIAQKIFDAYGRIAQLLVVVYGIVARVAKVFNGLINLAALSYYSLGSTWNGPIGGAARYFGSL